jgi:hypothetical protein
MIQFWLHKPHISAATSYSMNSTRVGSRAELNRVLHPAGDLFDQAVINLALYYVKHKIMA